MQGSIREWHLNMIGNMYCEIRRYRDARCAGKFMLSYEERFSRSVCKRCQTQKSDYTLYGVSDILMRIIVVFLKYVKFSLDAYSSEPPSEKRASYVIIPSFVMSAIGLH
jgi:hypothetical protein